MADAYVVVFAALMLPAGLLGDRFGRRRMLITGLGVFLVGSLVGALADDVNAVIAARAVAAVRRRTPATDSSCCGSPSPASASASPSSPP